MMRLNDESRFLNRHLGATYIRWCYFNKGGQKKKQRDSKMDLGKLKKCGIVLGFWQFQSGALL